MSAIDTRPARRIPSFMLRGFWDELDRRGVSHVALENASGVRRPTSGDFLSWVSTADMHRLFVAGEQLTKDARIGLSVGRAMGATSFHLVGHLVLASSSLKQAIDTVARAEPQFGRRLPQLEPLGDRMRFGIAGELAPSRGAQIEAELTAVLLHDVARMFLDERCQPGVQFAFAEPKDTSAYRHVFAGEIEFESGGTYCVFPRSAMRRRSGLDMSLLKHLFSLARDHYGAASEEHDWASRVRAALRSQHAPRLVDPRALAAQLSLSPSALSRRLAREGVSVSQLLDEVLFERARAGLRRPGATAALVAEELGYAELSSFFRAFRRWSGVTPGEFRERGEE